MPTAAVGQITITDLKDTIGLVLSNEAMTVAAAPNGTVASLSGVATTATVLLGGVDDSANWTLTAGTASEMTGTLSGKTYTVTALSADNAYVDLTASRTGFASLTKRFSVSKSRQGTQGVQGPTVTITANRALSFTSTDGTLDASQTDIVFTAATTGITSPTYAWSFTGLQTNPTASTTASQTITAAQFGTSRSATVTCTVGTYKETLTIVRLEKSTAAAGATVGATWGTDVSSIPSNLSTAGSTPTIDLRNNQIGLNASGQLYGAGAGNGTTLSNAQISVDTATGVIGGIGTGAGTAVANSQVAFSARQTWEFRGSAEGWTGSGATITANADTITLTSTGSDPTIGLNGLAINGAVYDKLRMRVRRVAGTGWEGKVYFATSATSPNTHNLSESYYNRLTSSLLSASFVLLEWDMANLTVGGNNWTASTITALRLDLGSTTSDVFEIDWISVGKCGHDVDLVLSASSQIVAGTDRDGVILDAASKSLQVVTGGNERVRLGNQAAAVNGSAYGFVVKDNSGNVVFDSRNAVGIVGNQAHDNYNLGDSSTNPFWNTNTNGVGNVAIGALALRGDGLAEASGRSYNVAIGYQALRYTTVGTNIAIGNQAGRGNPAGFSGGDNTVIGYNAMVWGTTAAKNVAIGRGALRDTTSGSENTAVGYLSQSTGDIASYNTSLGFQSLRVATGSENTSVGHNSGYSLNTGSNNTFVGKDAGYTITTGSGNTFLGYKAYTDVNQSNQTIIASGAGVVLKHSGALLETSHNISSGGNITATGTVKGGAITVEGSGPSIRLLDTDAAQSNFWIHANSSKFHVLTDYNYDGSWEAPNPLALDNATTTANIYGQKAWTAGNDGADSGLDADLLDGQHGSYYLSWANFTNKPTSPQGFSMAPEEMGANVDLDTKTTTGWFSQANNTEATVALHYPVALAGLLEVFAYNSMIHQRYWVYNTDNVYQRTKFSTGAWNGWVKIANVDDNVATASKLASSVNINGVAFDGSANITVADPTKLPLSGGTMTGAITLPNNTIGIKVGDDAALADRNAANTVFVEGLQNTDRGFINFSSTTGNALGAIAAGHLTWRGNTVWHAGNDGTGSGLDADTLDGYQTAITATVSTAAVRDGSGDIHTRLIRSEYGNDTSISGALAYRVESTSGGNNYVRFCSDTAAIKAYLGVVERDAFGGYYPPTSGRNIDNASAGDVGLYSKNGGGTWPSNLVSEFAWVETQKMYTGNASVQHAVEYTGTGTPTGEQWFRTRSNAAAPYVWSTWKRVVTDGNIHAVLNNPKNGDWFNGGYMSIRSDGVMNAGKHLDWHNATTDTTVTSRTTVDSTGLLTHSAGLKVKGTGGLGYAFGGVVTQLTSRDTGVTLNTPSGRITLASVAVTQGTLNKFTLTNSCIAATDVVMVCMQNSGTGRYNVFVDRVAAGSCDIRLQNQATTASGSCSINFVIIKGSDS